jgi:ABC-type amino acid transport substrate-binding protein
MKKLTAIILSLVLLCTCLTACSSREKVDISGAKNISELKGAIIAAQSDTFHLTALDQIKDDITIKEYPDFTDLLTALNSGAIDGYVAEEPTALTVCGTDSTLAYLPLVNNSTGFTATDAETGIAVAFKTGSDYVVKADAIISTISAETRSELMKQIVKMTEDITADVGELVLKSANLDTSKGTLKIAMECAYQPFNWAQTTDVNGAVPIANNPGMFANGYDVQVAKYIAAELGMALEVYQYEWDSLIPAVQSGAVDGIIAGMSPTAEREEEVDFSDCYYNSNLVIIYKVQK